MQKFLILLLLSLFFAVHTHAQDVSIVDDFEGNGTIDTWFSVDCIVDISHENPQMSDFNESANVMEYRDLGGQNAQVGFDAPANFDFSESGEFSLKIYVPSSSVTGNQENRVSVKLQDGNSPDPSYSETEIVQPIVLDQWQELSFNFLSGDFQNAQSGMPDPVLRTDFNRVIIQVNGENNNDLVRAYIDDFYYNGVVVIPEVNSIYTELVWSDEFEANGPVNDDNWFHQTQLPLPNGWFNGEIQHYTDRTENSFVEDGFLRIVAKNETFTDQGLTLDYTSARLNSKFAFTYGRVEVRARLPFGLGTWPAIWTLGKNIIEPGNYWTQEYGEVFWPACGEIDIMEHWGNNQNYVSAALHTPSSFGGTENTGGLVLPDVSNTFHVYSMEWSPEEIRFFIDGFNYYTYAPVVQNAETWPFDEDQYLLLNVAMINPVDQNFSQSEMIVDYVRVYQESSLSTNDKISNAGIQIYPNPTNGLINFRIDQEWEGSQLAIYSSQGELLDQRLIQNRSEQVNMSRYSSGIYMLMIGKGKKKVLKKVVLTKH